MAAPEQTVRAVVACRVMEEELRELDRRKGGTIQTWRFVEPALHAEPHKLRAALQEAIDDIERTEPHVTQIVLGIGLCSGGVDGIRAQRCTLVMIRSDDCIGLFLGDPQGYRKDVLECPGTVWFTPGWVEHRVVPGPIVFERLREEYSEQFDEDTVEYLVDMQRNALLHYERACFVDLTIGDTEKAKKVAIDSAREMGWTYEHVKGDTSLLQELLAGEHEGPEFCTAKPSEQLAMSNGDDIVCTKPLASSPHDSEHGL